VERSRSVKLIDIVLLATARRGRDNIVHVPRMQGLGLSTVSTGRKISIDRYLIIAGRWVDLPISRLTGTSGHGSFTHTYLERACCHPA
jgi:hypothetical protein